MNHDIVVDTSPCCIDSPPHHSGNLPHRRETPPSVPKTPPSIPKTLPSVPKTPRNVQKTLPRISNTLCGAFVTPPRIETFKYDNPEPDEETCMAEAAAVIKPDTYTESGLDCDEAARTVAALLGCTEEHRSFFLNLPFEKRVGLIMFAERYDMMYDSEEKLLTTAKDFRDRQREEKREREEKFLHSPEHKRHKRK